MERGRDPSTMGNNLRAAQVASAMTTAGVQSLARASGNDTMTSVEGFVCATLENDETYCW